MNIHKKYKYKIEMHEFFDGWAYRISSFSNDKLRAWSRTYTCKTSCSKAAIEMAHNLRESTFEGVGKIKYSKENDE